MPVVSDTRCLNEYKPDDRLLVSLLMGGGNLESLLNRTVRSKANEIDSHCFRNGQDRPHDDAGVRARGCTMALVFRGWCGSDVDDFHQRQS